MPEAGNVVSVLDAQADHVKIVCVDNDSLEGRIAAFALIHNITTKTDIQIDSALLPAPGYDPSPPDRLLKARRSKRPGLQQHVQIAAGETLRLGCIFQPEDIVFKDGSQYEYDIKLHTRAGYG